MGCAGLEEERVARFDLDGSILVPDFADTGNNMVELPLRTVRMEGIWGFAWRNS